MTADEIQAATERLDAIKSATTASNFEDSDRNWLISTVQEFLRRDATAQAEESWFEHVTAKLDDLDAKSR